MQNNTPCQGPIVESPNAGEASPSAGTVLASLSQPSAIDVQRSMFDVSPIPPPPFDELQATQARADLIQFTKIFFGLDNQCPSHSDILSA
jgi:hypothetical protein